MLELAELTELVVGGTVVGGAVVGGAGSTGSATTLVVVSEEVCSFDDDDDDDVSIIFREVDVKAFMGVSVSVSNKAMDRRLSLDTTIIIIIITFIEFNEWWSE